MLTVILMACLAAAHVEEVVDIAPVWAGHPVQFALLTHEGRQFAAYYDADRHMTVAARTLGQREWHKVILPEDVKWDSHNSIVMAMDDAGCIHLSGNMHCVPLVYFRTRERGNIDTFERAPMVGMRESKATYPVFMRGPGGQFLFTYRDGGSGNGDQIYNVYNVETKTWRRLMDTPLTDGEGLMNAYFHGPLPGPDGFWHLCWVWRDTSDCATNHDLCYARSRDLVHWETGSGRALELPIKLATADIVDPVPPGGGIINVNKTLGFDSRGRVIIAYHKHDANGNTQAYNARLEGGVWKIYQVSDWEYRWDFQGRGTIVAEIHVSGVKVDDQGQLTQSYSHVKCGSGTWILDETTLRPVGKAEKAAPRPPELSEVRGDFPGLQNRSAGDSGSSGEPGVSYTLRWETLGANRDQPREGELPPPSMLRVVKTREAR